ncbi:ferric reductase like transmembrane component-domain-containing protein [Lophiotrema nucula]|uniref:ferric-chelate reductase (NADPH) n=1 Tax=Lophiotrema nucula TaxID=690887 RepID=A0A6A5ZFF9_9PLEO|nr:ferric reductase like transmembrane component-domain-containing protein [Lophiotrema nucula]
MESMAWLTYPLALTGSREFECGDFTAEECSYYKQRWHFWYIADYVFALPTVAFFMCAIGVFIIGHVLSSHVLGYRRFRGPSIWRKSIATLRYLAYRGFHVRALGWNSASVGVLLLGLVGTVFFFCMDLAPKPYYWADEMFGGSPPLGTRSGWMALACMPFVFATASKTNWITFCTGVSHERLQVFHRWISYAFFLLALLHTFPFIVYHVHWHDMEMHFSESLLFYWTGIVALIAQAWLTFASHSSIRNLGYEFFKATHFIAVVIFVVTFFWHCDYTLTSWHYFIATGAVYVPCFVYPWLRTCFEYRFSRQAQISVEDCGFTRITIPAQFDWKPGQHCFLRFTGFGFLQSLSTHPFTICSLPSTKPGEQSELVFYIRHQGGFTSKLYQHAMNQPGVSVPVLVDGPYGGANLQRYRDSDHLLVIAGGSGAGWCLPFIERFVRHSVLAAGTERTKGVVGDDKEAHSVEERLERRASGPLSVHVVLATRDTSSRMWFLRTVGELLSKYAATVSSSGVRVQVYLTGEAAKVVHPSEQTAHDQSSSSPSISSTDKIEVPVKGHETTVPGKEYEGRPRLSSIIHEEAAKLTEAGESLGVFVCGPGTMQNDVRNAVAAENLKILKGSKAGGVYLHSEHFSWA